MYPKEVKIEPQTNACISIHPAAWFTVMNSGNNSSVQLQVTKKIEGDVICVCAMISDSDIKRQILCGSTCVKSGGIEGRRGGDFLMAQNVRLGLKRSFRKRGW